MKRRIQVFTILADRRREVVLPLARQRIELDLDDSVKVNYLKFPGFLAKIPGLEKKEEGVNHHHGKNRSTH